MSPQPTPPTVRDALAVLLKAYCSVMKSEFDYPGRPWTPERDDDRAALDARLALDRDEAVKKVDQEMLTFIQKCACSPCECDQYEDDCWACEAYRLLTNHNLEPPQGLWSYSE